jgi:hypothetical protein
MVEPEEIVEADDELSEAEWEDELDEFDPIDLVEAHLAGVPFN